MRLPERRLEGSGEVRNRYCVPGFHCPRISRATARSADVATAGSFVLMRAAPAFGPLAPNMAAAGAAGVIGFSLVSNLADYALDPSIEGVLIDGFVQFTIDRIFIGYGEPIGLALETGYGEYTRSR